MNYSSSKLELESFFMLFIHLWRFVYVYLEAYT